MMQLQDTENVINMGDNCSVLAWGHGVLVRSAIWNAISLQPVLYMPTHNLSGKLSCMYILFTFPREHPGTA